MSSHFKYLSRVFGLSRGSVVVEFALIVPVVLVLSLAVFDFGSLIYARHIVADISREGGILTSYRGFADERYLDIGNDNDKNTLFALLQAAGQPLDFGANSQDAKIIVSKIMGAISFNDPLTSSCNEEFPCITGQVSHGSLGVSSGIGVEGTLNASALPYMYRQLEFDETYQTAHISQISVVEVFYKYRPIIPLTGLLEYLFVQNILRRDGNGIIITSRSVF